MAYLLLLLLAQQCTIPGNVPPTRETRVDYKNRDIATDYYALAVSWSPQFCNSPAGQSARNRWQCEENRFGFVVHGLWPQSARARRSDEHPRHCKAPEILSTETMKPYLCTMPGAQLIQDEWVKHGTCAWPNAKAYLQQVETLYRNVTLPDLKGGRTTAGAIKKTLVDANRSKGLKREHVRISVVSGNRFSEALICYDKKFQFAACVGEGTPDDIEVSVAGKR
ncbi:MAG: ribonuclease T [Acidobacteria bacterium]|nr:ribonuclease T [Acidobacteriota bacterium]